MWAACFTLLQSLLGNGMGEFGKLSVNVPRKSTAPVVQQPSPAAGRCLGHVDSSFFDEVRAVHVCCAALDAHAAADLLRRRMALPSKALARSTACLVQAAPRGR
jgi:hypothetical protein